MEIRINISSSSDAKNFNSVGQDAGYNVGPINRAQQAPSLYDIGNDDRAAFNDIDDSNTPITSTKNPISANFIEQFLEALLTALKKFLKEHLANEDEFSDTLPKEKSAYAPSNSNNSHPSAGSTPSVTPSPSISPTPSTTPSPSASPAPATTPSPSGSPTPAAAPSPSASPAPAAAPSPSGSPAPAAAPATTANATPSNFDSYQVSGLGANKQKIVEAAKNAGATNQEIAQCLAIANLETDHMSAKDYVYGDGKTGDAANFSLYKMNKLQIGQIDPSVDPESLNNDPAKATELMIKGMRKFGAEKFIDFHRGGESGLNGTMDQAQLQPYRAGIGKLTEAYASDTTLWSDDRRVKQDVFAI